MRARLLLALAAATLAAPARAQIETIEVSPDVTVELGGAVVSDEDAAQDDLAGNVAAVDVGAPESADLTGYAIDADGAILAAFDTAVSLGGVVVTPGDVVRLAATGTSLAFEGSAEGVLAGAAIDAVAYDAGALLLSFDVTVSIDGIVAEDEDLLRFPAGGGAATLAFDGSAEGVPSALDLDAADLAEGSGLLRLSFDVSGSIHGVGFDDEDVLAFDPADGSWALEVDGSEEHAAWGAADLDALHVEEVQADGDGDGVPDGSDNCLTFANADQRDTNLDGYGNRCDPDLNNDGIVGLPDFNAFRQRFGCNTTTQSCRDADFNGDGVAGLPDFNVLRAFFGNPPGPSGLACAGTIPCPAP